MKRKKSWSFSLLTVLLLLAGLLPAAEGPVYGHISFLDNGAIILREDGGKDAAVVNLPLAPGDTVVTSANGRCELQFDNGTVVRLDKGSRLRLATILAPSLTSNWNITTLELASGQLYALPQSYAREMFQIVTPNAAVNLKRRVRATIRLDADGGTSFFSDGGKFQLLYGADSRSLKKATVRTGRPLAITAAHVPAEQVQKRDIEFSAWNEYVDRHFKDLHYGINKVPPKLKFGNTALTYWAEKWSSLFGEWIYDELFGYVWRPADDRFAHEYRPFLHASFTRVDGQLFLVPQEAWGWVPAHMGTWVWMKRGWTWIPGDWFHNGIVDYNGLYSVGIDGHYYGFPTFGFYWRWFHSYASPWDHGGRLDRETQFQNGRPVPRLPKLLIEMIKRVDRAPESNENKRGAIDKLGTAIDNVELPLVPRPRQQEPNPAHDAKAAPIQVPRHASSDTINLSGLFMLERDWNPDRRLAARRFYKLRYSSAENRVICPELERSARRVGQEDRRLGEGSERRSTDAAPPASGSLPQPGANDRSVTTSGSGAGSQGDASRRDTKEDKG